MIRVQYIESIIFSLVSITQESSWDGMQEINPMIVIFLHTLEESINVSDNWFLNSYHETKKTMIETGVFLYMYK